MSGMGISHSHGECVCSTPFRDARLILFVYFSFVFFFFFVKVSRLESSARPTLRADPNRSPVYFDCFHLSYQNILFMSFCFKVFNCAEVFSNGRPINIYSYTIRLQNGVSCLYKMIYKKIVQSLTILFIKGHTFKKEMICIRRGIHLYAVTFSMTLCFLILPSLLFTRNLRID